VSLFTASGENICVIMKDGVLYKNET
jgi:hypothetical protein